MTTIAFALSIPIALLVGRASDRIGARKPFLMLATIVTAGGLLVMALFPEWPSAVAGYGLRSEEHTSELQSLMRISYAVFCLKKKKNIHMNQSITLIYYIEL